MVIELSDVMFAEMVKLACKQTCEEMDEEYCPDYDDGVDDGKIILARTFLDEAVIVHQ